MNFQCLLYLIGVIYGCARCRVVRQIRQGRDRGGAAAALRQKAGYLTSKSVAASEDSSDGDMQPISTGSDTAATFFLITPLVISLWRGGWELLDQYLYPGALQAGGKLELVCAGLVWDHAQRSRAKLGRVNNAAGPMLPACALRASR